MSVKWKSVMTNDFGHMTQEERRQRDKAWARLLAKTKTEKNFEKLVEESMVTLPARATVEKEAHDAAEKAGKLWSTEKKAEMKAAKKEARRAKRKNK